jgi:RNA recognition motif. (a.k.a. RRM, RBD, or RNP domain)
VTVGERQIEVREDDKPAPKASGAGKAAGGAAAHPPPAVEGSRVQVDNLSWETTDEELAGACCLPRGSPPAGPDRLGQWRLHSATDGTPKSTQPPDASHHAALFRSAGTVVNAHVVRQSSGRSKGWALVDFASSAEAQQVRGQVACAVCTSLWDATRLSVCSPHVAVRTGGGDVEQH